MVPRRGLTRPCLLDLRLCLCSIDTTICSREAWDVLVPLLLSSLLFLVRKSSSVHFFPCFVTWVVSSFTPTKHLHLRRAQFSMMVWTSCCLHLENVPSCFWVNSLKCDLNLPHCLGYMETLFQMRLQVDKMHATDVVRLGEYKVLALCCIFFIILRNSQMCYL